MNLRVRPARLTGEVEPPGDKSIAHRALMLAALASGYSRLENMPDGQDVHSTAACLASLGAEITGIAGAVSVKSLGSPIAPRIRLDTGNSGTTMRLLSGILAAQPFDSELTGDESLRKRPMARVIEPLARMGAIIESSDGKAPLVIRGSRLHGIRFQLPIASAQVKSAVLLAGLFAEGITVVEEPVRSRDHTERMLQAAGIDLARQNGTITVAGGLMPKPLALRVPGDISSAAFFLAGGALSGGEIIVRNVGLNPTRTGFLSVLARMGVSVETGDERLEGGEPTGSIRISGVPSRPVTIGVDEVPLLVDELPLVALLATQAAGTTIVSGAGELRLKESDRIATVVSALRTLGGQIDEREDGFAVHGPVSLQGGPVSSQGDHRMAMMLTIAGSIAVGETIIAGMEAAAISYPGFVRDFISLGGHVDG